MRSIPNIWSFVNRWRRKKKTYLISCPWCCDKVKNKNLLDSYTQICKKNQGKTSCWLLGTVTKIWNFYQLLVICRVVVVGLNRHFSSSSLLVFLLALNWGAHCCCFMLTCLLVACSCADSAACVQLGCCCVVSVAVFTCSLLQ